MNRLVLAATTTALLALASCSSPDIPTPAPTTTVAPTTTATAATHRVLYDVFGLPATITYTETGGSQITQANPEQPIIEHATLLDGDTAKIEATGDNPSTGLGCSIIVDGNQVATQTSYNAQAGVACTYTVR